jgi:hypothetical protein
MASNLPTDRESNLRAAADLAKEGLATCANADSLVRSLRTRFRQRDVEMAGMLREALKANDIQLAEKIEQCRSALLENLAATLAEFPRMTQASENLKVLCEEVLLDSALAIGGIVSPEAESVIRGILRNSSREMEGPDR